MNPNPKTDHLTPFQRGVSRQVGVENNMAKLDEHTVRWILDNPDMPTKDVAIMLEVSETAILRVRRGETWKHIPRPAKGVVVDFGADLA